MKKSAFLMIGLVLLFAGCKGSPEKVEKFDIDKLSFDYIKNDSQDKNNISGRDPFVIYKTVSYENEHYLFCMHEIYDNKLTLKYNGETVKKITLDKKADEAYFNGDLDITDPDTFSDFVYKITILDNDVNLVVLPLIEIYNDRVNGGNPLDYVKNTDDNAFVTVHNSKLDKNISYTIDKDTLKGNVRYFYNHDKGYLYKNFTDLSNKNRILLCKPSVYVCSDTDILFYKNLTYAQYWGINHASWRYNKNIINTIIGLLGTSYEYDDLSDLKVDINCARDAIAWNRLNSSYRKYDIGEDSLKVDNINISYSGSFDKLQAEPVEYAEGTEEEDKNYLLAIKFNFSKIALYDSSKDTYTEIPFNNSDIKWYKSATDEEGEDVPQLYYNIERMKFSPYENKVLSVNGIGFDFR